MGELVRRLAVERNARGDFAAVQVCREDSGAVPDSEEAKLVILHPRHVHARGNLDSAALRFAQHRYGRDFTRLAQEVLQHLAAVDGTNLEVTVEITATNPAGFPRDKTRVVSENARTLKFDQFGFEDR